MDKMVKVYATSSPTGLNIICRRFADSDFARDVYVVKMVMNPETGQRYFSFSPLFALAEDQTMTWVDFKAFAGRGVHSGIYTPSRHVIKSYLEFVDCEERTSHMKKFYLEECGPAQEYLDREEHERAGTVRIEKRSQAATCDGNVIKGVFGEEH